MKLYSFKSVVTDRASLMTGSADSSGYVRACVS